MKRTIAILALLGTALLALGLLYRSENLKPVQTDLQKYPELTPFLAGMTDFRGIRFNVDTNYYSFAFRTHHRSAESYFDAIHSAAGLQGWELANSGQESRVYQRRKPPIGPLDLEKVSLQYNSARNEVVLVREEVPR